MAAEDFFTDRAFEKMKHYGLSKSDVVTAMSSGDYRDCTIPGATHKVTYLKHKGLMVGVIFKAVPGGRRVVISCWGRKQ